MKFIKYKQVARITLYGLNSHYFRTNLNAGVQVGNNAKRMRFQFKG